MTPTFQILAAGSDITGEVGSRLVSLTITDTVDEDSDGLNLVLEDAAGTLALPSSGAKIEVSLGYNGANQKVGSFVVDEVEVEGPPDRITVQASSTPFVSDKGGGGKSSFTSRKSRSFEGKTIGEIVQTIAGECGLSPVVDQELTQINVPYIAQVDESDSNLLLRLARRYGGVLKPADGRLVLASEAGGRSVSGAALEVTLTPTQVTSWRAKKGGKAQGMTKVKTRSYSYEKATTEDHEAKIGGGQFSFDAPAGASGSELDSFYQSVLDQNTGPDEAKASSKTKATRIERSKSGAEINMPGTLSVIAGGVVNLSGFRPGVSGKYKVVRVTHSVSRSGWATSFSAEGA